MDNKMKKSSTSYHKVKLITMNNPTEQLKTNGPDAEMVEKKWSQILAILVACLAPLTVGLLYSWPSPSLVKIIEDKENYNISLEEASYFTVIPPIGMLVSSIAYSKLNDIFGRKWTLWTTCLLQTTSWLLIMFTRSVYVIYLSRFLAGVSDACLFASLPIYVGEIATPNVRGTWGNAVSFFIYFGQLLINIIGSYLNIQETAYICIFIPIVFGIAFPFMPESPYFLIMKGRMMDATRSLQWLRRRQNVDNELKSLISDVERQLSESGTWKDLFTIDSNRRAIYAGIFLRLSQQLSGIATFSVYTQYIFKKSGGNLSASLSAIIFTTLLTILSLVASCTLDKFGRKSPYLLSLLCCAIILLMESVFFFLDQFQKHIDLSSVRWVPITGMIMYIISYSFGLAVVPTLMLGELFSSSIKGKALCLMNIIFAIVISTTTKLFQVLETNVGMFCPFLFFSTCSFISSCLSTYVVPETKGKTLEEIQQSLKRSSKTEKKMINTLRANF